MKQARDTEEVYNNIGKDMQELIELQAEQENIQKQISEEVKAKIDLTKERLDLMKVMKEDIGQGDLDKKTEISNPIL